MKKLTQNIVLTSIITLMLGIYGCGEKSVDSNQKELTEYLNQIRLDNWKNDKHKVKELQKMFGVLLYNQLPIEKTQLAINSIE